MSLQQANAHHSGNNERLGVPVDNLKKVMIGDSDSIAARGVSKAKTNLEAAIGDFNQASNAVFAAADKLHASNDELSKRTKVAVSRAKDSAAQMSDAMLRITKMLGTDFEIRLTQLERLTDAMERLSALQTKGQLADVIKALSK